MIQKEIILNKETREIVNKETLKLGIDGENLQENIIFKFEDEFVDGQARIEIELQDETKTYIVIQKHNETYELPIKSVITKHGLNYMQLVITQGIDDEEIPIFKSEKFSFLIKDSINAVGEAPEGYPQWIELANANIQIEEGTTATTYEEYTGGIASPNPSYPQEVKTVKGYRNLFDKDNALYVNNLAYSNDFSTFLSTYTNLRVYYINCKPNTTYTYNKQLGSYCRFGSCVDIPANNGSISVLNSDSTSSSATIITGANDNYIFFSPLKSSELSDFDFDDVIEKVQITESNTLLPYVPYGTNWIYTTITDGTNTKNITLPLNNNEIAGIGDYKDEYIVDKNGHCWLNKKTGKVVLNGSENDWEYQSNSRWPFRIVLNDILPFTNTVEQTPQNILCNYFSVSYWNNTDNNGTFTAMKDYNKRIAFANTATAILEDFKTWLSTHNTDVYYVLAEENLIDLNYNVDLTLYSGTNNITNSEDMDMAIKYVEDINTILATLTTPGGNE